MREAGGRLNDGGFRKDVEAIKDDIAMLKGDLASAMRDLIDAGRSGADDARKRLQEIVGDRLESLNEAAENLSNRGRKVFRDVQTRVEEKPVQTIGIALAVGAAIGLLFFAMKRR
jgi:ElaB/YqjD/DUF883 family membrane-anchored ribosome-binding protein